MTMFHAADFERLLVRRPRPKLVDNFQARLNQMHVRMLLEEKQPCFAAMLESVVREFALESMAPGSCSGARARHLPARSAVAPLSGAVPRAGEINQGEQTVSRGADRARGLRQGRCGPLRAIR